MGEVYAGFMPKCFGIGLLGALELRVERKENGTMLPQMAMLYEHDPEPLFGILSFYAREARKMNPFSRFNFMNSEYVATFASIMILEAALNSNLCRVKCKVNDAHSLREYYYGAFFELMASYPSKRIKAALSYLGKG